MPTMFGGDHRGAPRRRRGRTSAGARGGLGQVTATSGAAARELPATAGRPAGAGRPPRSTTARTVRTRRRRRRPWSTRRRTSSRATPVETVGQIVQPDGSVGGKPCGVPVDLGGDPALQVADPAGEVAGLLGEQAGPVRRRARCPGTVGTSTRCVRDGVGRFGHDRHPLTVSVHDPGRLAPSRGHSVSVVHSLRSAAS